MVRFFFHKANIVVEDIVVPLSHSQMAVTFVTSLYQRSVIQSSMILAPIRECLASIHALIKQRVDSAITLVPNYCFHAMNMKESCLENIYHFASRKDHRIFLLSVSFVLLAVINVLTALSSCNKMIIREEIQKRDEHIVSKKKTAAKSQTIHRLSKDEVIVHSDDSSSSLGNRSATTTSSTEEDDNGSATAFNIVIDRTPSFESFLDCAISGKMSATTATTTSHASTVIATPTQTPASAADSTTSGTNTPTSPPPAPTSLARRFSSLNTKSMKMRMSYYSSFFDEDILRLGLPCHRHSG